MWAASLPESSDSPRQRFLDLNDSGEGPLGAFALPGRRAKAVARLGEYGQRRFRPWRGKGWGEPKYPIEPRFGCLDLEVPNTFYLPPFGGADLVIGRTLEMVA